jgi:hypothetical protein
VAVAIAASRADWAERAVAREVAKRSARVVALAPARLRARTADGAEERPVAGVSTRDCADTATLLAPVAENAADSVVEPAPHVTGAEAVTVTRWVTETLTREVTLEVAALRTEAVH